MLALQLLCNGIVTGCALGIVAVSFSFIYATTKIFHVAHAGVYTMGGYVAWSMLRHGLPAPLAFLVAIAACTALGALIQGVLYARLERRRATHLSIRRISCGSTCRGGRRFFI
jgi:branched-chain amino acid transport system permease protein